ncbi:hypothetical protein [Labrenzia sp. PHM005]|uniref:hypothetical protein n=1 Tax=Labrenzia sp. PHM005 TaxID=2590016 RepID=UPI00113FF60E|nr:hypothetical protein [Labrenzia sp. PHM005]QDG78828.1 hypothetical protein FJ695_24810 [Labrenzia sp. PHM005]
MNKPSPGYQATVRYPLRRHQQQVSRKAANSADRPVRLIAKPLPKKPNWGARMLIAFSGWLIGVAAVSLVMFAEYHYPLAKNRDPDLFAIVIGTGLAGHAIYALMAALAVALLTAFNRRKWILWVLIGFAGGLVSI